MIEVNEKFVESDAGIRLGSSVVLITPPIDSDYFIARVPLFRDQAIQIFPKFGLIGCGFSQEKDWNTNLPLKCSAKEIFDHIKHNKKYSKITEEQCISAICELQEWCKERKML